MEVDLIYRRYAKKARSNWKIPELWMFKPLTMHTVYDVK